MKNKAFYICVLLLSAAFLFIGNRAVTSGVPLIGRFENVVRSAVVTEIIEREEHRFDGETDTFITFRAQITNRELRGMFATAEQRLSTRWLFQDREVNVGDRVIIFCSGANDLYVFSNHIRVNYILYLGAAFLALVILFGKMKGLNSIISLGFTCMAIFTVFLPAILSGRNIYAVTIIVCAFAIVSTLLIVIGPNKKAVSSMLGCLGGVLLAGLIMFVMDIILNLTGFVDHESSELLLLPLETPVNLNAILFAGVTIGAVGAIMDVSMSIASSLWEVRLAGGVSNFKSIFTAGINIGKDILGTMLNTLILAYIGSSLSVILLITARTTSLAGLFNSEMVIVEFLRALTGSFGMFLAIPLTAAICGWLYSRCSGN